MDLNWGKLQLLQVRCDQKIKRPDGSKIEPKDNMVYLGASVSDDGRIDQELVHRVGMANVEFRSLAKLWKHSLVTRKGKLEVFQALIESKLMYGLTSAWLSVVERRRVDGFQNRCLRQMWGIKPSFISRVSNKEVLKATAQRSLSEHLLQQQLSESFW